MMVTIPVETLIVLTVIAFMVGFASAGAVTIVRSRWARWCRQRTELKRSREILDLEALYGLDPRKDEDR